MHITINMMWVYPEMGKLRNQDVACPISANNGVFGGYESAIYSASMSSKWVWLNMGYRKQMSTIVV
jgi:hypothetical protein